MPVKKKKAKKVSVNRKFLLKLADSIYNPKTKSFLRLCDGTLQNGPDPTDKTRPMHCGLGELYYAMTGKQPRDTGINEEGVIDLAVELSPLNGSVATIRHEAYESIHAMNLSDDIKYQLIDVIDNQEDEDLSEVEAQFRDTLGEIPTENDDACGDACTATVFRKRSKRVADKLRLAAKLLPA